MAWLAGWAYRKAITVTNSNADYQTKVLVGESSGATGEEVDCGGHVAADFDDLRFTAADGTTLLDYWIESITGTTPNCLATVWVQNNATPDTTIYMYYGGTQTAVSNGDNTFIFFDDFPGIAIDTNKWTGGTSKASVASSILTYKSLVTTDPLYSIATFSTGVAFRSKRQQSAPAEWCQYGLGSSTANTDDILMLFTAAPVIAHRLTKATAMANATTNWASGSYKTVDILRQAARLDFLEDGVARTASPYTDTTYITTATVPIVLRYGYNTAILVDWVLIRKYVATEPTFAFGSEELPGQPMMRRWGGSILPIGAQRIGKGW